MKSLLELNIFPKSYLDKVIDFSPVDYCSRIINTIILQSNCVNKIFHIYNTKTLKVADLLKLLEENDYHIKVLPDDDFLKFISLLQKRKNELGIINDITNKQLNVANNINIKANFTTNYMKQLNLGWPNISISYILNFLKGDIENV